MDKTRGKKLLEMALCQYNQSDGPSKESTTDTSAEITNNQNLPTTEDYVGYFENIPILIADNFENVQDEILEIPVLENNMNIFILDENISSKIDKNTNEEKNESCNLISKAILDKEKFKILRTNTSQNKIGETQSNTDEEYIPNLNESGGESNEEYSEELNENCSNMQPENDIKSSEEMETEIRNENENINTNSNETEKRILKHSQTRRNRDLQKRKRMLGKKYFGLKKNKNGRYNLTEKKPERKLKETCKAPSCRRSKNRFCQDFLEEDRQSIFNSFWALSWDMKRTFMSTMVDAVYSKRKVEGSRRNSTLQYFLKLGTIKKRVCKKMFLSTLDLSEWMVKECSKKANGMNTPEDNVSHEGRQRTTKTNIMKEALIKFLSEVPKLESHYCRASSSKLYLEPIYKNKADFYREYISYCKTQNVENLSKTIFLNEMQKANISLYKPKKDQCDLCLSHKHGNASDEDYIKHQTRKEQAREVKNRDKIRALEFPDEIGVFTVDMQAVKLCPVLQANAIYYKKKLCVHNYTIYNLGTKEVLCCWWDESQGGLEANHFATILTDFFTEYTNKNKNIKELIIYSDGCGYQNKNTVLSNALLKFAIDNNLLIIQNYLEKGHTQMEVDSVHSTIERRLKNRDIYLPTDYIAVTKEARLNEPYKVRYLHYSDFKCFKNVKYYTSIRPGYKTGDPVVSDLCSLKYLPTGEIQYKIDHKENYATLPKRPTNHNYFEIKPLYKDRPNIKHDKYEHLQQLKSVLDKSYWDYYDKLPH